MMKEKLLNIQASQWFKLDDREDKESVIETIKELIVDGYKFIFSDDMNRFMRCGIDLFEWAKNKPEGSEIKVRNIGKMKCYDLYFNGKIIAIK